MAAATVVASFVPSFPSPRSQGAAVRASASHHQLGAALARARRWRPAAGAGHLAIAERRPRRGVVLVPGRPRARDAMLLSHLAARTPPT
eukprot:COSAG03_NODE_3368_length_2056_cov_4.613183_2_plen_89_part_00